MLVCGVAVVPSVAGRVLTPGSSTAPAAAGPSGTAAVQLYSVQCTPCSTAHACCAVLHRNVTPVLLLHHRTPPPSPVTLSDSLYYYTHFYYALSTLSLLSTRLLRLYCYYYCFQHKSSSHHTYKAYILCPFLVNLSFIGSPKMYYWRLKSNPPSSNIIQNKRHNACRHWVCIKRVGASSFLQSQSLKLWNNEDYKGIWIEDDMEYGGHNVWVHNVKIFNIPKCP